NQVIRLWGKKRRKTLRSPVEMDNTASCLRSTQPGTRFRPGHCARGTPNRPRRSCFLTWFQGYPFRRIGDSYVQLTTASPWAPTPTLPHLYTRYKRKSCKRITVVYERVCQRRLRASQGTGPKSLDQAPTLSARF